MSSMTQLDLRGRHQHISPAALVTRNPSAIKIRSDQLTYRILLGLLDGKNYTKYPARCLAEYRQTLPKCRGHVDLALSPRSEESWDHVLASLHLLGDELVDTFLKGSYTARQRLNVIEQVHILARTSVYATLTLQQGKPRLVESPLVEMLVNEQPELNETGRGHLKIGDWAAKVPELQYQTAVMARQVLQYHAKKQKHEKRLGR